MRSLVLPISARSHVGLGRRLAFGLYIGDCGYQFTSVEKTWIEAIFRFIDAKTGIQSLDTPALMPV